MTVDGTDYSINEPQLRPGRPRPRSRKGKLLPYNPKWYTKKYQGAGVRYEIGVCIQTGDIVWTNGPFPCGRWQDLKIFQHNGWDDGFGGDYGDDEDSGNESEQDEYQEHQKRTGWFR